MSSRHECPGGCGNPVPRAQLACRPCWFRLPDPLRNDIWRAWRLRPHDAGVAHQWAVAAALNWYRLHRDAPAQAGNPGGTVDSSRGSAGRDVTGPPGEPESTGVDTADIDVDGAQ